MILETDGTWQNTHIIKDDDSKIPEVLGFDIYYFDGMYEKIVAQIVAGKPTLGEIPYGKLVTVVGIRRQIWDGSLSKYCGSLTKMLFSHSNVLVKEVRK